VGASPRPTSSGVILLTVTDRQKDILKAVVEHYLEYGEPLGSKSVSEMGFSMSSATIRNEMGALEVLGLLEQPHTSAGRIPSHKGLRYYIDYLMHRESLTSEEQNAIDAVLYEVVGSYDALLHNATQALASITELAAITAPMDFESSYLRHVEVVPTGRRSALVVLVMTNGIVRSRQCRVDVDLSPELLNVVTKMLNDRVENLPISSLNPEFIKNLAEAFGEFAFIFKNVFIALLEIAGEMKNTSVSFEGEMNLLINNGYEGHQLKELMDFIAGRDILVKILEKRKGNIAVVIGQEESRAHQLEGSSIIVAKYKIGGKDAGTIGLIGPTRLDYRRMIPRLEYFANEIGKIITQSIEDDES